nr:MAG TPA: hypothetical protein [Caudoviricetes sp.]
MFETICDYNIPLQRSPFAIGNFFCQQKINW